MIKIALIGCGKVAEQHVINIQKIPGFEIVGICDREILMAEQTSQRFNIARYFDDPEELLQETAPEIVHITTPPQSHYTLGVLCVEAGCHVLIEKPFTVNAQEAAELLSLANGKSLKISVNHNAQFSHAALRMRQMVKDGYLGKRPVHMESIFCYNLGDQSFARAFLGDKRHWLRQLPGKLLHNIISHGIGQIAEFLYDEDPQVMALGFTSDFLLRLGESEIIDELRVIIRDKRDTTAYFTFSSQMTPKLHQFRIFGSENGLVFDDDRQLVIKLSGKIYKSYLDQFLPPILDAKQYLVNVTRNVQKFLTGDFHNDACTRLLIEAFYRSVTKDSPVPVSHREIMTTARIMDKVFEQVAEASFAPIPLTEGRSVSIHR